MLVDGGDVEGRVAAVFLGVDVRAVVAGQRPDDARVVTVHDREVQRGEAAVGHRGHVRAGLPQRFQGRIGRIVHCRIRERRVASRPLGTVVGVAAGFERSLHLHPPLVFREGRELDHGQAAHQLPAQLPAQRPPSGRASQDGA